MTRTQHTDVAIIGAGPAGSLAAALLRQRGRQVTVIERSHFPRFAIGESLLPQCMESLAAADMLEPLAAAGFQPKNGVMFAEGDRSGRFDFADQYTAGWGWTWHVKRAEFDRILATEAARRGADVRFGAAVEAVDFSRSGAPRLTIADDTGDRCTLAAGFVCDASGAGRLLPRMLGLERPVDTAPRAALFTHVHDHIDRPDYRRDQILVTIHPERPEVWYWLIAFADGQASVGVVGDPAFIEQGPTDRAARLQARIAEEPRMTALLEHAVYDTPTRQSHNFAASVPCLHGRDYALLGNSAEFIDPIFSSGVTLALKSAVLAAGPIDRQLAGTTPDWDQEFEAPMRRGIRVFRSFVDAWYDGTLKHVFFRPDPDPDIRRMLASLLAGYVWDTNNPYAAQPERRLRALCEICAA